MTIVQVKGKRENGARAGTQTLTLLSTPIVVCVLQALDGGSKPLVELRREAGAPPQTTMRGHLRTLTRTGVVTRLRRNDFPGSLDYELTSSGRDLWAVAEGLRSWLAKAPDGPLPLGSAAAKSAIKALVEGWGTNIVRALAAKPLSLTELNSVISGLSYPSLERRLGAMRLARQIERTPGVGRGTPYAITDWLRCAVAPLAAATRWEHLNTKVEAPSIGRLDAEATLLLAVPMLNLPSNLSGSCRLAVEIQSVQGERLAGVLVSVKSGQIAGCATKFQGKADAWASGSAFAWIHAVLDGDAGGLEIGGDCDIARALLDGLHGALGGQLQRQ